MLFDLPSLTGKTAFSYRRRRIRLRHCRGVTGGIGRFIRIASRSALDQYIPPDIFAAFVPSFPPPGPEDRAFAQSLQAGDMDPGLALGGDRERLTLHPRDEALIHAVTAANPKTIVAVMAGSAVIMEAWRERAAAILMLWYPGMEGGHALAEALIGRVNPSGRLPCVFPARAEDLPTFDRDATAITYDLWHGYRKMERDGASPAFPFGFGLSYARFDYANLRLTRTELTGSDVLEATVEVTNVSDRPGEEVVQLYVAAIGSKVERAPKELKAFARVALAPGETRAVRLAVARRRSSLLRRGRGGLGGRADRLRRDRRPPFLRSRRFAGDFHGRLNAAPAIRESRRGFLDRRPTRRDRSVRLRQSPHIRDCGHRRRVAHVDLDFRARRVEAITRPAHRPRHRHRRRSGVFEQRRPRSWRRALRPHRRPTGVDRSARLTAARHGRAPIRLR